MTGVVVPKGGLYLNTSSGLAEPGGFLDRLTGALDARAQYEGQLAGYGPALRDAGIPAPQPQSLLGQLLGAVGIGGQPQPQHQPLPTSGSAGGPGASPPTAQPTSAGPGGGPTSMMGLFANAIAGQESGGRYDALGPVTKSGDRAYGKFQVMGSNIGPWTREVLGQAMSPADFLANPQAQDATFNGIFGKYLSQTGSPQDAASMWFSGKPYAQGAGLSDQNGTSGSNYVRRFMAALPGYGGGGDAQDGAGMPAQMMAYAPGASSDRASLRPPTAAAQDGANPMPIARSDPGAQQTPQSSLPPPPPVSSGGGGPGAQGSTVPAQAVLQTLMANPTARQQGGAQAWSMYRRAAANGGAQGGLALPGGVSANSLAAMIAEPTTMQQGLELFQRALYPQVTAFKPGDFLTRGGQPMGQVPTPLQHVEAGRNIYGDPTYGNFNQQTGVTTPDAQPNQGGGWSPSSSAQGQGTGPAPSPSPSGTNEAFLSTLPPPVAATVKAIAENRMKMPPVSSRSPIAARMPSLVLAYKPDYDQTTADARFDTRKNFTTGPAAVAINSGNTAVQHGADLSDAAEALGNSNYPVVNKLLQAYGSATGKNVPGAEFKNALNDFADEVTKFYRGTGGSEADIQAVRSALDPSQSPDQLRAGIQQQVRLIAAKTSSYQNQWHLGMGANEPDFPIFSKDTQAALARLEARRPSKSSYPPRDAAGGGQAPLPTASPAGSIPTITDPAQVQALPPGSRFRTPDGQLRVRH